ncbi:MAG: rRNA maturation RNase YbeY [Candidatus Muiribacteriota bacterium]|jgi:probable rRNA maturation factor
MREELVQKIVDEIVSLKYDKQKIVDVSFVDKNTIKELNTNYRNIDKETDVLSFSMVEGEFGNLGNDLLGDVVICKEVVKQNAEDLKRKYEEELLRVLIHGLLHLLDYDHGNEEDEKRMFGLQEELVIKYYNETQGDVE